MKSLGLIVLGCLFAVFPLSLGEGKGEGLTAVAQARGSDDLEALVTRVDARYAQIKDFQADFVQETRIQGFDTPVRSSGRVYLKNPGGSAGITWNPRSNTFTCIRISCRCTCPPIIRC